MLVAIAGGHGKVALRLARLLSARGDRVRGIVRDPAQGGDVEAAGAEPVVCNLERDGPAALARAVQGADAVVFAAGAGPGSGAARKETVDYGGAVALIEAARAAGVRRYAMLSAIGAANPPAGGEGVGAIYARAKARADAAVAASGLDYTIVRPAGLTDEPGTGRVRVGVGLRRAPISRDDVAAVLAAVLAEPATIGLTFELTGGDEPIAEAIARLAAG